MRHIKKLTLLFFVAASMFAVSCTKEEAPSIPENQLVGIWEFPSLPNSYWLSSAKLEIMPTHDARLGGQPCTWTLDDKHFTAYGGSNTLFLHLELDIHKIQQIDTNWVMTVEGTLERTSYGGDTAIDTVACLLNKI